MTRFKHHRAALCASAATMALAAFAGPQAALAQSATYSFDIPSQDVSAALLAFGRASRQQLVFDGAAVHGKQSAPVQGDFSAQEGLQRLLSGTGLKADYEGSGAVRIVSAQDPQGGSAGDVDALIVTAQKREENIQDVPIAISAFSQEDLTRSQIAGGPDLMTQIPNMTFTKTNFASYSIQIRGIGTQAISATTDPAVAVAFNNTPFVRNRFFEQEFFDLQRVEVLRGPQGTLYGRNATAGVVNIISQKPRFNYEAKLSGDVANYNSTRLEGMVNIPLVEDAVALRLAGAWTKRDGFATNELSGNPIDGRDLWSTRLSLRFSPNDRIDANLIWEHFEEDDDRLRSGKQLCKKDLKTEIGGVPMPRLTGNFDSPPITYSQGCAPASLYADESFQTPNGYSLPYYLPLRELGLPAFAIDPYLNSTQSRDLRVIESTIDPVYRAKSDLAELQVSFDLTDNLTLASETSYSADILWSMQDYNRFTTAPHAFNENATIYRPDLFEPGGVFCDPQLGCSDRVLAADLSTAESRQFSQELRLSSDFDGPFNFNLGANYLRYDTEDKYYVFINTLTMTTANQPLNSVPNPWVPGVTDGLDCMYHLEEGDATKIQQLVLTGNCMYIDPNPIDKLNDEGHNYFLSKNPYKLISYAAFGEAYYNISENLKITAGFRMTVDKKEAPIVPSWLLAIRTVGYPVLEVVRQEWREPTGRLAIDWKPDLAFTDETLLYASYAHGYKAGGANPPPATIVTYLSQGADVQLHKSLTHPRTFDAEYVDAFEVGSKNTLFDGRVTLNVTGFYYDYKGYQISQIVDRAANNLNFDADVWGLEIEADWRPVENLRLGFKGGYENTRVADGMQAIDLMDRTAGHVGPDGKPDWVVARPFPTVPSNCIVPVWLVTYGGALNVLPGRQTPNQGPCIMAYQVGVDPVTELEYVADPQVRYNVVDPSSPLPLEAKWADYPGFNPLTAPNNGEGFAKDLSGNELPNAPHFTATLTADYTLPLPNDWLMTLHSDLYYQSEAWTRIFNMEGYDKLKAYSNINLAAIFANEDSGWNVMAYVKNVLDRDSITGAFLNSDDTGLTTNVFLTEPRLYGVRVSKSFTGGSLLGSFGGRRDGPYPITLELGGSALRNNGDNERMSADELDVFTPTLLPDSLQGRDLDWGDGGEARLTYRPAGTPWRVSAGVRFGKANGDAKGIYSELADQEKVCGEPIFICQNPLITTIEKYSTIPTNSSWVHTSQSDDHMMVDFMVGRDVGMGAGDFRSSLSGGLGYARITSRTDLKVQGIPDWVVTNGFFTDPTTARHHWYDATLTSEREFEGVGPVAAWEASQRLRGDEETGTLSLAWTVGGGVLFGKRKVDMTGDILSNYYISRYNNTYAFPPPVSDRMQVDRVRSKSLAVPTANLSLGLAYEVDRFKVDAGYRWERYFDVIDGGDRERKAYDRTIDGPYFKIAIGFGG